MSSDDDDDDGVEEIDVDQKHGVYVATASHARMGKGLFALRSFKKGDFIINYAGEPLDKTEYDRRYPVFIVNRKQYQFAEYIAQIGSRFIDAVDPKKSNYARYINHKAGAAANAKINRKGNVVALKSIAKHAEIFFNYGTDYWKAHRANEKRKHA